LVGNGTVRSSAHVQLRRAGSDPAPKWLLPAAAILLAAAIFAVDTFTPTSMAVAVLYVIVILIAANFCDKPQVLLVALGCGALTLLSFAITHGAHLESSAFARCLVSLAAICITTILVMRNKSAEMVLKEQANLLDVTHDAVFVRDAADVIRYWNRGAEELYGWRADEAIGKRSHELMRTAFPVPLHEIMTIVRATGKWEGELSQTKRDGSAVIVASRWSLQSDDRGHPVALLETNNDVSERRRAENALRRSEAHLAEAQRLSTTGSFGWNPASGDIVWSAETYRIFDYDPALKPTAELIVARTHPGDRAAVTYLLQHAGEDQKNWTIEHRLLLPDGTVKYVSVVAHAERDEAGALEFVGAIMDVTAARRAEDDLRQAQANLAHVNRVSTLGEMTASIAHEVSQPIAAMLTNAGAGLRWLKVGNVEEVHQSLNGIMRDGQRASEVISRIRALSMKRPPHKEPLNINGAVSEIITLARGAADRSRTEVRTELGRGLPLVLADRVQVQQVLLNLVMNAIEAMSSEPHSVRTLSISTAGNGAGHVEIAVGDTGPGLDEEQIARVFDAFYTTKANGVGMGLAICRSIVEAHDGRLWVGRNEPRGAIFRFSLPSVEAKPG
jgi:PAS domain S-box-containing protein